MKTALITGGTKGIGFELCKQFAKDKCSLIMVARNESELRNAKSKLISEFGINVEVIAADLSKPEAPEDIYKKVKKLNISIDDVVNNAGFGILGPFSKTDLLIETAMIQTNIIAPVVLTKLFLQDLQNSNDGGVLNVASTAAFQPGPLMSIYYASKAFLFSFSIAIAEELNDSHLRISTLCPGPTRSHFQDRAGIASTRLLKSGLMGMKSSEEVAAYAYRYYKRGKRVIIPGTRNKLGYLFSKLAPLRIQVSLIHMLNRSRSEHL